MDLTFQVPMQYCSLQHQTLLPSPITSTMGCYFCFGSISSFFLELFLHWSPVANWYLLTWRVHLTVSYLFTFSYCSWGSQGKNIEVVCHSLLQWTTFCQTSPPWPVCLGWPHTAWLSFIELDKLWSMSSDWPTSQYNVSQQITEKNYMIVSIDTEKVFIKIQYLFTITNQGNGTPLQYCCLENPMDRGAWWDTVHGVTKSQTRLSNFTFT